MNRWDLVIVGAAELLQVGVACYAIRLNRLFGMARVGWSLFCAFLLLALLHLIQAVTRFHTATEIGINTEILYAFISLLLLTSMVHLETMLKERMRVEREEERMRTELESEVKKKTAYLTRAIEELQAEMDERKRMEAEVDTARWELQAVSQRAEMAQIAAGVLASIGEMLQSVNASADLVSSQVKQSKIANVVNVCALIHEHSADLGKFMTEDPRGQKLPVYIAQLAEHLETERSNLLNELTFIKTSLEKIVAMQQDYAKLAGAANRTNLTDQHTSAAHNGQSLAHSSRSEQDDIFEMSS